MAFNTIILKFFFNFEIETSASSEKPTCQQSSVTEENANCVAIGRKEIKIKVHALNYSSFRVRLFRKNLAQEGKESQ